MHPALACDAVAKLLVGAAAFGVLLWALPQRLGGPSMPGSTTFWHTDGNTVAGVATNGVSGFLRYMHWHQQHSRCPDQYACESCEMKDLHDSEFTELAFDAAASARSLE
jgi:hypothetical protein